MMKKVFLLVFVIVVLWGCKKNSFTILGEIEGFEEKTLILINNFTEREDSVKVKNGIFVFSGKVDEPTLYSLFVEGERFDGFSFYVENTLIKITNKSGKINELSIEGGTVNDEYNTRFGKRKKAYREQSKKAYIEYNKAIAAKDTGKARKIANRMMDLEKEDREFLRKYIKKNPESYVAANEFYDRINEFKVHEIKEFLEIIDLSLYDYYPVKKIKNYYYKVKLIRINTIAPDFLQKDIDGKSVKLSEEYKKSKYLLIDFWASWCKPCRDENPNLVDAYKKYNKKGFDILGVSLDKKSENWKKAIEKDKLTWKQVSDLKGWNNQVARQYMVDGIPANFLVDNNGKIVARDLRGEKLHEKLEELLLQ